MPPAAGTRGRKRKRTQDDEDDTSRKVAFEVSRDALDMLRETLHKLQGLIKDASTGPSDNMRTLQLDAMVIHSKMMDLHFEMISPTAIDANMEREAHSFQRQAFKIHQKVDKLQPQLMTPESSPAKIKSKTSTERPTRNYSRAADTPDEANMASHTEDVEETPHETADMAIQVNEAELVLPQASVSSHTQTKIKRIPRFFLETLSENRYEEFTFDEITEAFRLGVHLATFLQSEILFRDDYSTFPGGLVGNLYSQCTEREDWDPSREDAVKKKWFSNSKELVYAHYALEVLEVWRAQRGTARDINATTDVTYWALEKTQKHIAYAVRWMRYLKVTEPIATLVSCMIIESTRRA
ncbi:hypothetical protein PG989_014747 [Apiospora arundinis]